MIKNVAAVSSRLYFLIKSFVDLLKKALLNKNKKNHLTDDVEPCYSCDGWKGEIFEVVRDEVGYFSFLILISRQFKTLNPYHRTV